MGYTDLTHLLEGNENITFLDFTAKYSGILADVFSPKPITVSHNINASQLECLVVLMAQNQELLGNLVLLSRVMSRLNDRKLRIP